MKQKLSNKAILWWTFIGAVATIAVYIYVVVIHLDQEVDSEHLRNSILLLGGIIGLAIAIQRAQAADKQADATLEQAKVQSHQVENVSKQIKISQQRQITERFTHAVELLGSDELFFRLGAIVALEQIAQDSKDYILEVLILLAGFIREKSHVQTTNRDVIPNLLPLDIQRSVSTLSQLARKYKQFLKNNSRYIDLSFTQLSYMRLPNLFYLSNFDLRGSNLSHEEFNDSDCSDTDFSYTNLAYTKFTNTNLADTFFVGANLSHAEFKGIDLSHTTFNKAILDSVKFDNVDMRGTNLGFSQCNGTSFENARNVTKEMLSEIRFLEKTPPIVPEGIKLPNPSL